MSNYPTTLQCRVSEVIPNIEKVEKHYNCTFVGDFCIKDKSGQYTTDTVALFWQEHPPVEGYSHYFALFVRGQSVFITSGASVLDASINVVVTPAGEVVYSRHRHDYRQAKTSNFAIDGGRDYVRIIGCIPEDCKWATLVFDGPIVRIVYKESPIPG